MNVANSVVAYYDETRHDFRLLWDSRALHFGHYSNGVRDHAQALENTNRVLADRIALRREERVLDAGCGVGGSSIWLARHRGVRVTGVTLVQHQAETARRAAREAGLASRVDFLVTDYTATPFLAATFDVVLAIETLCHAPEKRAFYQEVARLLRPGGRVVIAEYVRRRRGLDQRDDHLLRDLLHHWSIPDLDTAEEHLAHMAAAGFVEARIEDETEPVRPSIRRLYRMAMVCRVGETMLHMAGLRTDVQHANLVGSFRLYQALERDLWFYGILSARRP